MNFGIVARESKIMKHINKEKLEEARVYYDFPGDYKPWSGAVDTWDRIMDEDKLDALEQYLDEMYPDGIDETELNDLLLFEPEYIFEILGISDEEDEEDDDEEDEDEEWSVDEDEPDEVYNGYDLYDWDNENFVSICKGEKFIAKAASIGDAKRKIDSGELKESKIREGFGPQNSGHKIIKYHGFCIEKSFYDDDAYPYSVQYCGDDVMFKTLKAAKEFIDDIQDVESIDEKKIREHLEHISNRAYGQWVALKNKMGDEYLADYVIDNIPKHEAELIIDYLADVNGIEVDDEGNNLAHGFLG